MYNVITYTYLQKRYTHTYMNMCTSSMHAIANVNENGKKNFLTKVWVGIVLAKKMDSTVHEFAKRI